MKRLIKKTIETECTYIDSVMDTQTITEIYTDGLLTSKLTKHLGVESANGFCSVYRYNENGQVIMEEVFDADPVTGNYESDDYLNTYMFEVIDEPDGGYTRVHHYDKEDQYGNEIQYSNDGAVIRERTRDITTEYDGEIYDMDEPLDAELIHDEVYDTEQHYDLEGRLVDDISYISEQGYHYEYVESGLFKGQIIQYRVSLKEDGSFSETVEGYCVGTFERDSSGHLSRLELLGDVTEYEYDEDGLLILETKTSTNGYNSTVTRTEYIYE